MDRVMEFYRAGRREGSFETGIQRALYRILASPKFVVRVEPDPLSVPPGVPYRLGDYELASRLLPWECIPDDQLADSGCVARLVVRRGRFGACWPTAGPRPSSATSPASGCAAEPSKLRSR